MTKEEIEKTLGNVKPLFIPYGCQLSLVDFAGDQINLKFTCPQLDVFKVQGKIVRMEDEIRDKISKRVETDIKDAKVNFV
jgi:hypothetical protein